MVTKKPKYSKAREASKARKVRKSPISRTEDVLGGPSFAEGELMADPTTILDYSTRKRDDAKLAVAAAQAQLAQAQSAIASESENLSQATSAFSDLNKQADEARKKLAAAPTSADGEALLYALEQLVIRSRTKRAGALKAQAELDAAKASAESAQTLLNAASARLVSAESALQRAMEARNQRDKLKAALAAAPLSTINADADAALQNDPGASAKARVEADFPAGLLARAEERFDAEVARIARTVADSLAADDAALAERDVNGGAAGHADEQWQAFSRAEAAARDFVNTAKSRFDQAQATLAGVADAKRFPLTPEASASINDATLKTAREAAAAAENIRDDELKNLSDASDALEAEILKAKAENKNPDDAQPVIDARNTLAAAELAFHTADDAWRAEEIDRDAKLADVAAKQAALAIATQSAIAAKIDPETDANVIAARTALTEAENALETAEDNYKQSDHGILHAWEAAVPETTWLLLAEYEEASRALNDLKASDPAKLKTDLDQAEKDYVEAKLKADASSNVLEQLAAEQTRRAGPRQSARQNQAQRLFGALRGDN
jgi:hypothetical protein